MYFWIYKTIFYFKNKNLLLKIASKNTLNLGFSKIEKK